jgi:predicted nucleic acid-binding protein
VIFIDANIPMYIGGADHPNRTDAIVRVENLLHNKETLVTDAEVFQEILHRYSALRRLDRIPALFELTLRIVDQVLPIDLADTQRAAQVLLAEPRLSARDAVHLAVKERHGVRRIMSFDEDYDAWPGVTRIGLIV